MVALKLVFIQKQFWPLVILSRLIFREWAKTSFSDNCYTKKPKHFDIGMRVTKEAGGGARIRVIVKTVGPKTWAVKCF
jgi:hypothetical protein